MAWSYILRDVLFNQYFENLIEFCSAIKAENSRRFNQAWFKPLHFLWQLWPSTFNPYFCVRGMARNSIFLFYAKSEASTQ